MTDNKSTLYAIMFTVEYQDVPEWLFIVRDTEPTPEEANKLAEAWQREVQDENDDDEVAIEEVWIEKLDIIDGYRVGLEKL